MRQLLISSVARNLVTSESGMPPQWDKALRKNGQLAVDIIIAMQKWNLEKESIPDPRQDSVKPILEESEQAKAQKKEDGQQNDDDQSNEQNGEENDGENNEEETEEGAEDGEQEEGEDNEDGEQETEEPQE